MLETTTQSCPSCHGTGLIRSDDNLALSILRQIEEEGVRKRSEEVLVKCPVGIANFIMNQKRDYVASIEKNYGLSVRVEGDLNLVTPDYSIEKLCRSCENFTKTPTVRCWCSDINASTFFCRRRREDSRFLGIPKKGVCTPPSCRSFPPSGERRR